MKTETKWIVKRTFKSATYEDVKNAGLSRGAPCDKIPWREQTGEVELRTLEIAEFKARLVATEFSVKEHYDDFDLMRLVTNQKVQVIERVIEESNTGTVITTDTILLTLP